MERFVCGTEIISGEDALSALGQLGCRRLLVVTAAGESSSAPVRKLRQAAGEPETEFLEDGFPEATAKRAVEGGRRIAAFQPDLVAAVGSGDTLDLGKAMVCFSRQECPLVAVPTTFGTGREVTDRVMLLHNGRMHLLQDGRMRPRMAILDSALTDTMPRVQVGEGGFALLGAALEAYTAAGGDMLRQIHAREAFASGWAALPAACLGNASARRRLMMASALTGMALDRNGPGLCTAMAGSLQQVFGLSEGKAAAILMPAVVGCNAHVSGRQYAEISRAAGLGGSREEIGVRNLRVGLIRLRRELGLPGTLLQAGIDIRRIWDSGKRIVELTLEDPGCRNNPVTVDDFMVRRILEEITGRL